MNKELEEAIKRLDKFKSIKILYGNTFAITLQDLEKLQKAIERAEKEFIAKDKIREKIKELKKYIYTGENAPQDFLQYRVKAKIQVLQELLEGR